MSHRQTFAVIRLDYLKSNLQYLKTLNRHPFLCPMVKANAYGHGAVEVAKALESQGVSALGVALVEEGIELRQANVQSEVLVFGPFEASSVSEVKKYSLTPVVGTMEQMQQLISAKQNLNIHVKIDTGMHRLGITEQEVPKFLELLEQNRFLNLKGVATHIHSGSDPEATKNQLQRFRSIQQKFLGLNLVYHVFNSSSLLSVGRYQSEFGTRPGILLYGGSSQLPEEMGSVFKQVMTLKTKVLRYHFLKPGDSVSYHATWKAQKPSVIAVLPVGYADGLHRSLSNLGEVLFQSKKAKIVGTVCMDYTMIDVTPIVGSAALDSLLLEEVTIFGYDQYGNFLSANEVANKAGTISYETLTGQGKRVQKVFVE